MLLFGVFVRKVLGVLVRRVRRVFGVIKVGDGLCLELILSNVLLGQCLPMKGTSPAKMPILKY